MDRSLNESPDRSRRIRLDFDRPFVTGSWRMWWRSRGGVCWIGCQTSGGCSSGGVGGGGEAYSGLCGSLSGDRILDDWNSGSWMPAVLDLEPLACCWSCCVKLIASAIVCDDDLGVDVKLLPDFPLCFNTKTDESFQNQGR